LTVLTAGYLFVNVHRTTTAVLAAGARAIRRFGPRDGFPSVADFYAGVGCRGDGAPTEAL
jgi:hypothetical protein